MIKKIFYLVALSSAMLSYGQVEKKPNPTEAKFGEVLAPIDYPEKDTIFDPSKTYASSKLYKQPEYPGGVKALLESTQKNVNFNNLTEGYKDATLRVYITLIIDADGTVSNINILRDPGYGAGKEIERVFKANKTKWLPGMFDKNTPAKCSYHIPVTLNVAPAKTKDIIETGKGETIYNTAGLEVRPDYPGGVTKFLSEVNLAIDLKNIAPEYKNESVKVYTSFVVEPNGTLTNIKTLRDPGFGIGREIERVIKENKTKWSPGMQDKKPVRANYNLVVVFNGKK
jgi:hypothetical protein